MGPGNKDTSLAILGAGDITLKSQFRQFWTAQLA
jgi:hypothetical protein